MFKSGYLTLFLLFFSSSLYAADPLSILQSGVQKAAGIFQQDDLLPADQAFHFFAEVKDSRTLRVSWQIADGYYLYRERFRFSLLDTSGVELKTPQMPAGKQKQEDSGPVEVYYHEVSFDLPLQRSVSAAAGIKLHVRFQGCAERGVCYPPMEKTEWLDLPVDQPPAIAEQQARNPLPPAAAVTSTSGVGQSTLLLPAAILLIVTAVYFGALNRLPATAEAGARLKKALMLGLLIWGILLLVGVAADSGSLLHPLSALSSR
jgi:thiol:disulfide interchange protein